MADEGVRNPLTASGSDRTTVEMRPRDAAGGGAAEGKAHPAGPGPRHGAGGRGSRTSSTAAGAGPGPGARPKPKAAAGANAAERETVVAGAVLDMSSTAAQQHPLDLLYEFGNNVSFRMPEAWQLLCGRSGETTEHSRYMAAATYVYDAVESRYCEHTTYRVHLKAYSISHSWAWTTFMTLVCLAHMGLALSPADQWSIGHQHEARDLELHESARELRMIELMILMVYGLDMYLVWVGSERKKSVYFRTRWRVAKVVVMVFAMLDVFIFLFHAHNMSWRCLRCFWLLERVHTLRKTANSIGKCIKEIARLVLIIFAHVLLFSLLGFTLFSNWRSHAPACRPTLANGTQAFATPVNGTAPETVFAYENGFTTLSQAMETMFILLTTANFPNCMLFAYCDNGWTSLFFIGYLGTGVYLLMNLLLGIMFHTFKNRTADDMQNYKGRTRIALAKAFALLDPRATGTVDVETFARLMMYHRPGMSREEVRLLFNVVDYDQSGGISLEQFENIIPFLRFRYGQVRTDPSEHDMAVSKWQLLRKTLRKGLEFKARLLLPKTLQPTKRKVHRHANAEDILERPVPLSEIVFDVLVLANSVVLAVQVAGMQPGVVPKPGFETAHLTFLVFFVIELVWKLTAYGFRDFWAQGAVNKFDFILITGSLVAEFAIAADNSGSNEDEEANVFASLRSLRLLRVLRNVRRLAPIMHSIKRVAREIFSLFGVLFVLFYFYGTIGQQLYGHCELGKMPKGMQPYEDGRATGRSEFAFREQHFEVLTLASLAEAYVTLFHVLVVNNWWVTMKGYDNEFVCPGTSSSATWYFISFIVVAQMLIINLMVAFLLERFVVTYREERENSGVRSVENAIYEDVRRRFRHRVRIERNATALTDLEVEMYGKAFRNRVGNKDLIQSLQPTNGASVAGPGLGVPVRRASDASGVWKA